MWFRVIEREGYFCVRDYSEMDFEDQMDLFCVRRDEKEVLPTTIEHHKNHKQVNYSKNVSKCIPLMCKHITRLNENWNSTNVIKIFSDTVQFTYCMVYGKIVGREKEYKSSYKYLLDDGTASLYINVLRKTDNMKVISKMENELQAVRREMLAQNKNEIVDSLRNLLFKTKEQMDNTDFDIGSKILVYGKPAYRRGEVILYVYCFIQDEKCNRDIEISFKDYLISWYKNNRTILTNS